MIIKAERMRIEEDLDNGLWIVDFRDEDDTGLRGRIEIPTMLASDFADLKKFQIEVLAEQDMAEKPDYTGVRIGYNTTSFRVKPTAEERIYSFSAGGLMLRVFSRTPIKELRPALRKFVVLVR
ncbi:MAG: hypothetical protein ACFFE8_07795 [Candidatus Heimdallarchaeota archaeon]